MKNVPMVTISCSKLEIHSEFKNCIREERDGVKFLVFRTFSIFMDQINKNYGKYKQHLNFNITRNRGLKKYEVTYEFYISKENPNLEDENAEQEN